jgi:transcriptional regulator with XRE-family HTH domain
MSPTEFHHVGSRLRQARLTKRMRLKDVAGEVGCSESMLSKIERERVVPSLRILHRVAAVLNTSIAVLFADPQDDDVQIYRAGKRPTVILGSDSDSPRIHLERLVPHVDDQIIDGNVHVVFPGACNGGEIKHLGQEIGFVIEGQIELTVGQQEFRLKTGDSFFFRSSLPHSYRNTTSQISKVVWINAPPTF